MPYGARGHPHGSRPADPRAVTNNNVAALQHVIKIDSKPCIYPAKKFRGNIDKIVKICYFK